jgi:hypothetical protein
MNSSRRAFVLGTSALATSLLAWLTTEPSAPEELSGRRIGESGVSLLEREVRELRLTDDIDGGGSLIPRATTAMSMVAEVLSNRSYSLAHGRRLYAAAADLSRIRAWATFDVHGRCDDAAFRTALHCAHAADDPALGAHVLTFWSAAAYNCDRAPEAETLASTALTAVRGRSAPRVQALVHARRARAWSHLGDENCWTDLEHATRLLDQADSDPDPEEPEWAYWFDAAELLGCRASSQLAMGRPEAAEGTFTEAARSFAGDQVRTHTLYLTRQADAQLRQGHIEHACDTAHRALDLAAEISSQRTVAPLRDLTTALAGHQDEPAVADLVERVATLG